MQQPGVTIRDCLQAPLAGNPAPMLNHHVSNSTKDPTDTEKKALPQSQLQWVAPFLELIPLALKKLEAIPEFQALANRVLFSTDEEDVTLLHSLHPRYTGVGLPPRIHSEQDTTSHVNAKLAWPAAVGTGLLQLALGDTPAGSEVYVSSCSGKKGPGVPDAILYDRLLSLIRVVLEWKTANALPQTLLEDLWDILVRTGASVANVPIHFVWEDKRAFDKHLPSLGKILTQVRLSEYRYLTIGSLMHRLEQVWWQMHTHNVNVAVLSSFDNTLFFYRLPGSDTLHFSRVLRYNQTTVLHFMAIFALGLGLTTFDEAELPAMNTDNFNYLKEYFNAVPNSVPGLDER